MTLSENKFACLFLLRLDSVEHNIFFILLLLFLDHVKSPLRVL
jgi:hypothetical protein